MRAIHLLRAACLAAAVIVTVAVAAPLAAQQGLSAAARLDPAASAVEETRQGPVLALALDRPVPWRVEMLDAPPRLLLDLKTLDLARLPELAVSEPFGAPRAGEARGGWTRLVFDLSRPLTVSEAGMTTGGEGGRALIEVTLKEAEGTAPAAAAPPPPATTGPRRPVIVLDPGHGGVDPGAVRGQVHEADLMLRFARELREALLRTGEWDVVLTREADTFVSLEARIDVAREAGAVAFLSLHADAVQEGVAQGAQVYTLADEASSRATRLLAERHARDDLLGGVDLAGHDDVVAHLLIEMARRDTAPRTDALADHLVAEMQAAGIQLHKRPREGAGFSVLKAPDIPSALIEVGFISSESELRKLQSDEWRARMAAAIVRGLSDWIAQDASRPPG
ncbi:N-acetylmuramoyl-L-alanine amidase [Tropicimonas sp. IMCC34011]|uniref:N-acetylmuramoyl-L-alanine amidase family protein n=1 Tax=Tropicimonas sp. IMCC34011 TaxID=2248759 RepID=UPI000E26FF93|nr:N-acetylmuramoyl-L-alanine amidase [Tropicimonas sp. IMCC34011]